MTIPISALGDFPSRQILPIFRDDRTGDHGDSADDTNSDMLAMLAGLAGRGFRFSLDDFGTGYSSLAYLKQLALCKLKIDRRFVSDLPDDKDDAAIVQAIVWLAHHLDLGIVAEGIKT